ncbi:pilus assembly protein N-terminal domain-containing protein [Aestuariivirga sp.]|uniref:pilus assembly protein N-terminal domain-containing protein n=1 Tax=Aestuariivirga sp. TaxID=2650926 RepID=UPI003BAAAB6E
MQKYCVVLAITAFLGGVLPSTAKADDQAPVELVLTFDQSQRLALPALPSTIVVGNPAVADVTLDGKSLFLHARGHGLTNLVIYDEQGGKIGNYLLRVVFDDPLSISVYTPKGRNTFTCVTDCESTLRIGDASENFGNYMAQTGARNGFASSQASGDAFFAPTFRSEGSVPMAPLSPALVAPPAAITPAP